MSRLKRWHRAWLLWIRGECIVEGCHEPQEEFTKRCWPHAIERGREISREIDAEDFEREVRVTEEALRRIAARAARD